MVSNPTDGGPRLMGLRAARQMCGDLSESSIRRLIAEGTFPRPVVLSRSRCGRPCRIAFVKAELEQWVSERIASGREPQAA
jgi:predicted DNA-binding transcriptional regulator AlpA